MHLQPLEQLLHPLAQLVVVHAVQPAEVLDHFPGRHAVVDGRVGRDEADLVADHFGLRDAIEAADDGRAAGGLQHGAENPQGGRLAGAVGTQAGRRSGPGCAENVTSESASTSPRSRSEYAFVRDLTSIIGPRHSLRATLIRQTPARVRPSRR